MMRWNKAGVELGQDPGEKTITYRAEGCACRIESRKRAIKHASGIGVWYHTEYAVLYPDGASRVYIRLRDAQADAESYPRED